MSGAVRPLGLLGLRRRAEGEPRQAGAGLVDTPWCRSQGLASLGACSARLLLPVSSVIKLPYLSCLHHPHLHPMAHIPTPTRTRGPALPPTPSSSRSPLSPRLQEVPASPVPRLSQMTKSRASSCHLTPALSGPSRPQATRSLGGAASGWCDSLGEAAGSGAGWLQRRSWASHFHLLSAKAHQMLQEC